MEIPAHYLNRTIKCISCRQTFTAYPLDQALAQWTAKQQKTNSHQNQSGPPSPLASNLAASHIHLLVGGEQRGPYVLDQIRSMWSSGSLTADTLWWTEGMTEWALIQALPLSSVPPAVPQQAAAPTAARYNPTTDTFSGTNLLLVKLAIRAIQQLGWKLDNANESLGIVNFETGMSWGSWSGVSCSLTIEEVSPNTFRVLGAGKQNLRGGQLIAIDFGEAKGRATKAIEKMKELAR